MRVQGGVLLSELVVNGPVGCAVEVVDIGLGYCWAGEPDEGAGAEGYCGQVGGGELQVGFHRAVTVSKGRRWVDVQRTGSDYWRIRCKTSA